MLVGGKTTEFHTNEYLLFLPIASYTSTGVGFPIRFAYLSKATPFAVEACETNHLYKWKVVGRKTLWTALSHCSWPSCKFQLGTCVLGGIAWRLPSMPCRQAMGEGTSGPVETGLTGLAATALNSQWLWMTLDLPQTMLAEEGRCILYVNTIDFLEVTHHLQAVEPNKLGQENLVKLWVVLHQPLQHLQHTRSS